MDNFKKIKMNYTLFRNSFLATTLTVLVWGCSPNTEVTVARQDLILTVFAADGKPQANAEVVLFDNKTTFATQNYDFGKTGSVKSGKTDKDGKIRFDSLSTEVNYYVLTYTIDDTTYIDKGYRIYYDNSRTGFEFQQKLNKSATTYANVYLKPAEALVSFYADSFNPKAFPITIIAEGDTLGTINTISGNNIPINDAATPDQNGVITKKIRLGTKSTSITYLNSFKCLNIGDLTAQVVPGGFTAINVNLCNAGIVRFVASNDTQILVTLNGDNQIGTLNKNSTGREMENSLEPGEYTYEASSPGCSWQGKFKVNSNEISQINLAPCFGQ